MGDVLYTEPDGCAILGSFLLHNMDYPSGETSPRSRKRRTEINNSSVKSLKTKLRSNTFGDSLRDPKFP